MGWCSWRTAAGRTAAARNGSRWRTAGRLAVSGVVSTALLQAGCGGGAAAAAPDAASPVGREPGEVVAAFLEAANRRDHAAMAGLFGTAAGPIGETGGAVGCGLRRLGSWIGLGDPCASARDVELRMDVIARILAHESRRVGPAAAVAGRGRPATRVEVEMAVQDGETVRVPFVLIQAGDHGWLVEQVGLGRLTG